jgi:hypothetical protein
MNTFELIRTTRRLMDCGRSEGSGPASDADILANLNDSLRWLHARQISIAPMAYARVETLDALGVTATQLADKIVSLTLPDHVVRVIYLETENYEKVQAVHNPKDYRGGVVRSLDNSISVAQNWMVGADNDIILRGPSATSWGAWRLWYVRRPPDLSRFKASGGSVSAITVDTSEEGAEDGGVEWDQPLGTLQWRAGYYVGSRVQVAYANDALPQGEIRRVTGYTLGTFPDASLTVSVNFSDEIQDGDTIEMIPQLDEMYHELICYQAAARMADRLGNSQVKQQIVTTAAELYKEWQNVASQRQAQDPPIIARGN